MRHFTRKITKEQYDRAKKNAGYITEADEKEIFDDSERLGYGVYSPVACETDNGYIVSYMLGDSCD